MYHYIFLFFRCAKSLFRDSKKQNINTLNNRLNLLFLQRYLIVNCTLYPISLLQNLNKHYLYLIQHNLLPWISLWQKYHFRDLYRRVHLHMSSNVLYLVTFVINCFLGKSICSWVRNIIWREAQLLICDGKE